MAVQQSIRPAISTSYIGIDGEYVAKMLGNLGVPKDHPLAPSIILGSFDVMACVDLAVELPPDCNFEAVLQGFHTFKHVQPADVRHVQVRVLNVVRRICAPTIAQQRYDAIMNRLQVVEIQLAD